MSDLLEQAIVDAEALKEAALKTAKQEVLEKYSNDVKSAVEQLLEQEGELDLDLSLNNAEDAAEAGELTEGESEHEAHDSLPYKHRTLQREPQDVSINLQQLEEQIDKVYKELDESKKEEEQFVLVSEDVKDESEDVEIVEEVVEISGEEDIAEALRLDYKTVPTGHAGAFTESEREYAITMQEILAKYEDVQQENKEQRRLMEQAKKALDAMGEQNARHKSVVKELKDKLIETNLVNAKLHYSNLALSETSLNERQKKHIVEALSKADSLKHAKMIFETLKDTVGGSTPNKPKSLSEAVEKRSLLTVSPHRRKESASVEEVVSSRWKRLAGIK